MDDAGSAPVHGADASIGGRAVAEHRIRVGIRCIAAAPSGSARDCRGRGEAGEGVAEVVCDAAYADGGAPAVRDPKVTVLGTWEDCERAGGASKITAHDEHQLKHDVELPGKDRRPRTSACQNGVSCEEPHTLRPLSTYS